jgi:hypothetical protein
MQPPLPTTRQVLRYEHNVEGQPVRTELAIDAYLRCTRSPPSQHREASAGFVDRERCMDTRQRVYPFMLPCLQV